MSGGAGEAEPGPVESGEAEPDPVELGASEPGPAEPGLTSSADPVEPIPPGSLEPAWVRPLLVGSLAAFPVLTGLVWWATPLGVADALFVVFLLELLPALSVTQVPLAEGMVAEGIALERIPVYVTSAAVILLLGGTAFVLGVGGDGPELLGLAALPPTRLVLWSAALTAVALLLLAGFAAAGRALGRTESAVLRALIPRTPVEKGAFVGLSVAAGLGEELAYRAYAIPALAVLVGSPWAAAALSSIVFGFLHAYQGILGMSRAASLGFVLAASLLVTGSVLPAMLAHTAIDVIAGLFLGEHFLNTGG